MVGSFAFGPMLVAFGVGVIAGYALYRLDEAFGLTEKVTKAYSKALGELQQLWKRLGASAEQKFKQFENSRVVRYLGWRVGYRSRHNGSARATAPSICFRH